MYVSHLTIHVCTPLKIDMESKNHQIEQENHLPNLLFGFHVSFPECILYSYMSSNPNPGYLLYTRDYTTGMKPTQLYRDNKRAIKRIPMNQSV